MGWAAQANLRDTARALAATEAARVEDLRKHRQEEAKAMEALSSARKVVQHLGAEYATAEAELRFRRAHPFKAWWADVKARWEAKRTLARMARGKGFGGGPGLAAGGLLLWVGFGLGFLFIGLDLPAQTKCSDKQLSCRSGGDVILVPEVCGTGRPPTCNVGIGTDVPASKLVVRENVDRLTEVAVINTNPGTVSHASCHATSDLAQIGITAHAQARTFVRWDTTIGGWSELIAPAGNGLLIGALGAAGEIRFGTGIATAPMKLKITTSGHLTINGADPALSSCGTTPSFTGGSDVAGRFVVGSGATTSCTLTFAAAYGVAPHCSVTNETTAQFMSGIASTTALVITGADFEGDTLSYFCVEPYPAS